MDALTAKASNVKRLTRNVNRQICNISCRIRYSPRRIDYTTRKLQKLFDRDSRWKRPLLLEDGVVAVAEKLLLHGDGIRPIREWSDLNVDE